MLRNLRGLILAGLSAYFVVYMVGYVGDQFPQLTGRAAVRHPTTGEARLASGIVWKSLEAMADGEHRLRSTGAVHVDDVNHLVQCTAHRGAAVTVLSATAQSREVLVRSDAGEDCRGWVTAEQVVP